MSAHLAPLGLTCRAAYEALADREVFALEKRVRELELELYHEKLPDLRMIMRRFNDRITRCLCMTCQREKRGQCAGVIGNLWPGEHCYFVGPWRAYLYDLGIGVDEVAGSQVWHMAPRTNGSALTNDKFSRSPAAIWTANYEWVQPVHWVNDYGWGRQLSSMQSPRREMWDKLCAGDGLDQLEPTRSPPPLPLMQTDDLMDDAPHVPDVPNEPLPLEPLYFQSNAPGPSLSPSPPRTPRSGPPSPPTPPTVQAQPAPPTLEPWAALVQSIAGE